MRTLIRRSPVSRQRSRPTSRRHPLLAKTCGTEMQTGQLSTAGTNTHGDYYNQIFEANKLVMNPSFLAKNLYLHYVRAAQGRWLEWPLPLRFRSTSDVHVGQVQESIKVAKKKLPGAERRTDPR